ncbi:MAG: VCBS repeat-containing protein [Phycisphaerae bacterium]|jgi:hypothetical protein
MRRTSIGFKIGIVLAALHLGLAIYAFSVYINCKSSTAGLVFIIFFYLDAPLLLIPRSIFSIFGGVRPLIEYGVIGSALWFVIPYLIDRMVTFTFPKAIKLVRVIIIVAAIPAIFFGFKQLSYFAVRHLIKQGRPVELKKSLNKASSNFFAEKIVFSNSTDIPMINGIYRMSCNDGDDKQIMAALRTEVVFLNDKYQEQSRLGFGGLGFNFIKPLSSDIADSRRFLGYRYGKGVYVFDHQGKEVWKFTPSDNKTGGMGGAVFGDMDGDGRSEIAVFYPYKQGIQLIDSNGNTKWTHPVNAMGHLEMTDIDGDGKAEIIYDNSNNAGGKTKFEILNAAGTVIKTLEIATKSYEFALIKWPNDKSEMNILLTENNKIRLVDFKGDTVISLDAPGCREFGNVKAVAVKLKKQQPPYLIVRKGLHPDLLVMYVYDHNGKLVYQRTDVYKYGVSNAAVAIVPESETEGEKLLLASERNNKAVILEYSFSQ